MKIQFKSKHREQEVEMMDAGRYYIGDLCYVINDAWGEICDLTFPFSGSKGVDYPSWIQSIQLSGKLKLADNRNISIYGTAHGDGSYPIKSPAGNRVGSIDVDSGSIGCIKVDSINKNLPSNGGYKLATFKDKFIMSYNHGTISFKTVGGRTWDDNSKLLYTIDTGRPW